MTVFGAPECLFGASEWGPASKGRLGIKVLTQSVATNRTDHPINVSHFLR